MDETKPYATESLIDNLMTVLVNGICPPSGTRCVYPDFMLNKSRGEETQELPKEFKSEC